MADLNQLWGNSEQNSNRSDVTNPNKNGFQHNQAVPEPVVISDNSDNFWINNANYDALTVDDVMSNIVLDTLENNANQIMLRYASVDVTIPAKQGTNSYRLIRFRDFGVNLEPLREGQLPKKFNMSAEKVNVTTSQYAGYVTYTDEFKNMAPVDIVSMFMPRLIESALKTMDIITREVVYMGASKAFIGGATASDYSILCKEGAPGLLPQDLAMLVRKMKLDKVKPFSGSNYVFICDADAFMQLNRDPQFEKFAQNQSMALVERLPWEPVVTYSGISYVEIPEDAKRLRPQGDDATADVHVGFLVGKDGYVTVGMEGRASSPETIMKPLGSAGALDPLNQMGTMAYRIRSFGVNVLRPEAVIAVHYPDVSVAYDRMLGGHRGSDGVWVPGKMYDTSVLAGLTPAGSLLGSKGLNMGPIWDGSAVYPLPKDPNKEWAEANAQAITGKDAVSGLDIFTPNPQEDTTVDGNGVPEPAK